VSTARGRDGRAVSKPATAFPGVQEGISYGTPVRLARVSQGSVLPFPGSPI